MILTIVFFDKQYFYMLVIQFHLRHCCFFNIQKNNDITNKTRQIMVLINSYK